MVKSKTKAAALLLAFVTCLKLAPTPSAGQGPPYLVSDIGRAPERLLWELFRGTRFISYSGALFFLFNDGIHGTELWRTDLTAAGTYLVKDTCPGACGTENRASAFSGVAAAPHGLVFAANDGVHGTELWVSDGSTEGTTLLVDLRPGLASSGPANLTASGGLVFFDADDGVHDAGLWRTDGTPEGTWLGVPGAAYCMVEGAATGLFFTQPAGQSLPSQLLWTDGSPGDAVLLHDVPSCYYQTKAWNPFELLADGSLLFGLPDALWRTDGTVSGTQLVKQLPPRPNSPNQPLYFERVSGLAYFAHTEPEGRALWRTDGTESGTQKIAMPSGASLFLVTNRGHAGGRFFFDATDSHGEELWTLDGDSPRLVRDINRGSGSSLATSWWFDPFWADLGDRLLFVADDGVHGSELWTSDGSESGTQMVADLPLGSDSLLLEARAADAEPRPFGGKVPFVRFLPGQGYELWASDGTAGGTARIAPLDSQQSGLAAGYAKADLGDPIDSCLADVRGKLLFSATDGLTGQEPWITDGTAAGTNQLADLLPGLGASSPMSCTTVNGRGVFGASTVSGGELWGSDGTPTGTQPILANGNPVPFWEYLGTRPLAVLDGLAYGAADSGLFRTNGSTAEVFFPLVDYYSSPDWLGSGSSLFFSVADLLRSDGTTGGTLPLASASGPGNNARALATDGHRLFYLATDDGHGEEPWVSDGSPEGTHLIADIQPGAASSTLVQDLEGFDPSPLAVANSLAFFAADDGVHGEELWATDGTAAGTRMVADLYPGPYPSSPREIVALGSFVYFVAEDPEHGRELFRTDGGDKGIELVADLVPGVGSSLPQALAAVDGRLFFSAWTQVAGRELWILEPGKKPVLTTFEIAAGPLSSSPHDFTFAGGLVYFAANDNVHGFELWAIPGHGLFADGFESGHPLDWSAKGP